AGKQFGTDGSSYSLLNVFGHKTTNLYPSLVQIKTEREKIRGLKGLKEYALCTACDGDLPLKSALGDVMFTDYGVSGSAIFQISGHFAKAKNPILSIEFLPDLTIDQIAEILKNADKNSPIYNENAYLGIINKRIGLSILKTVQNKNYYSLAKALKNFTLKVTGSLGFDNAQVTKGGIQTKDVNSSDYQSKLKKGIYVIGEALDVDGDCGGYNLSFAFSSGVKCARAIKNG
ncbi:MAG: NAD(P)/FAD-dependent oxidoreductase, partial [Clostridia bacterium]|nr:NAD(P)/FAD-dependent oxidoreductase [Clostridia bacterium]